MESFVKAVTRTVLEVRILICDFQVEAGVVSSVFEQTTPDIRAVQETGFLDAGQRKRFRRLRRFRGFNGRERRQARRRGKRCLRLGHLCARRLRSQLNGNQCRPHKIGFQPGSFPGRYTAIEHAGHLLANTAFLPQQFERPQCKKIVEPGGLDTAPNFPRSLFYSYARGVREFRGFERPPSPFACGHHGKRRKEIEQKVGFAVGLIAATRRERRMRPGIGRKDSSLRRAQMRPRHIKIAIEVQGDCRQIVQSQLSRRPVGSTHERAQSWISQCPRPKLLFRTRRIEGERVILDATRKRDRN